MERFWRFVQRHIASPFSRWVSDKLLTEAQRARAQAEADNGETHYWYFGTLESANAFAKQQCEATGAEIDVVKYVGSWRIAAPPVEFIPATEPAPINPDDAFGLDAVDSGDPT